MGLILLQSRPQDLTLHVDVVHPGEAASRCHLLSFGVMGEKQRLCESQDPHSAPCSYTSPWMVLPHTSHEKMCTRRTEILHVSAFGGWKGGLVGSDSWGFEPETGSTGSTGQSDCHQAVLHHSTAPASACAWPGYRGRAAGKQDGR